MLRHNNVASIVFAILIPLVGCQDLTEDDKYRRPDWVPGKLYTTLQLHEDLSMFAECLELTGLDTIVDVSGCFAIFAPTNEAMTDYLAKNQYADISDIPYQTLEKLTEYHILQNPWSLSQLVTLGGNGWRYGNSKDEFSYAFKRQTLLKNPVEKFWIKRVDGQEKIILDSTLSDGYKKVFVQSRKYVPIFYDGYLNVRELTSSDYSFYFDRAFEWGNVYYGDAKIVEPDIFAENGFIHKIDRVVDPMLNAKEILERDIPGETYRLFLEMVNWYFPRFKPNMEATFNQASVIMGGLVDTLWNLNYDPLPFDLQSELLGSVNSLDSTLVYHNGIIVPTDQAFGNFIDGILTAASGYPHWPDYRHLPKDIVELIITPFFSREPVYPSSATYQSTFIEEGRYQQNEGDIIRREFGTNCTFIGLDNYTPDRVFTSITGPVYLRPEFSLFRRALQYVGLDDFLANTPGELCFFPIPDNALKADSTLMLNWYTGYVNYYYFTELNRNMGQETYISPNNLSERILNHVGVIQPNGSADKEFIPTMGGRYIIWNNANNTVQGNIPSTIGYNGRIIQPCFPLKLEEPAENGDIYSVNHWFNYRPSSILSVLNKHPQFFSLLVKAGLFDMGSGSFPFLENYNNYTVFVPNDEALINYQADTLSNSNLTELLKNHFLADKMIFTDNKQPSGSYSTAGGGSINIDTGPDIIYINDMNENLYLAIEENENTTNIMAFKESRVNAVVHEIDKVIPIAF